MKEARCERPIDVGDGDGDGLLPCNECHGCRLRRERERPAWTSARDALCAAAYLHVQTLAVGSLDKMHRAAARFTTAENDARRRAKSK